MELEIGEGKERKKGKEMMLDLMFVTISIFFPSFPPSPPNLPRPATFSPTSIASAVP